MVRLLLPIALLASAISFPAMLFERALPIMPDPARLETEGSAYHRLKNITTECFRADAQWWSKASCFTVLILLAIGIL